MVVKLRKKEPEDNSFADEGQTENAPACYSLKSGSQRGNFVYISLC